MQEAITQLDLLFASSASGCEDASCEKSHSTEDDRGAEEVSGLDCPVATVINKDSGEFVIEEC